MPEYWKSLDERNADPGFVEAARHEFAEALEPNDLRPSRRGFLKAAGFGLAGALASGCQRAPVESAIPYLVQPEEVRPGVSLMYASTCAGCEAACGTLVKVRDGRPIKLEGNPDHPLSRGGLCAAGQASLLGLYDSRRFTGPRRNGGPADWTVVDAEIAGRLAAIRQSGRPLRLLTGTIVSPTLRHTIDRFLATFPDAAHAAYDPVSHAAILDAHEATHGVRRLPRYRFDRADVVVGVEADFLGSWISPVEHTRDYQAARTVEGPSPRFSYHVQFDARETLTGAKADRRVRIGPDEAGLVLQRLALALGVPSAEAAAAPGAPAPSGVAEAEIASLAARLREARGRSLVVCGSDDAGAQILCNAINEALGNYGATLDLLQPSFQRQGDDRAVGRLLDEIVRGQVGALIVAGVNPVYDFAGRPELAEALRRLPLLVSLAAAPDETSDLAQFVCPDHHPLESWGDAEPVADLLSLAQPVIRPLGATRSMLETLNLWMDQPASAYDTVKAYWQGAVFPRQQEVADFQAFWDRSVHDGVRQLRSAEQGSGDASADADAMAAPLSGPAPEPDPDSPAEAGGAAQVDESAPAAPLGAPVLPPAPLAPPQPFQYAALRPVRIPGRADAAAGELHLALYAKVGLPDGRHAHNAWLQELPDPVTKVTWDNYACLSPGTAARLRVAEGDLVRVEAPGEEAAVELPVYVQPGQQDETVAIALGYGRGGTERFAGVGPAWLHARESTGPNGLVGVNAAPLVAWVDGTRRYAGRVVRLTKTGGHRELASTQRHHSLTSPESLEPAGMPSRPIVQETTLAALQAGTDTAHEAHPQADLWPADHPYEGPRWAMVVDLSSCTGCSACVVACQVENNVPVVGQDEVRRQREMHWIRIDRYYRDADDGGVDVVHQPMMCQHCSHAPCETVCPVVATVHSREGLNQQVYNRCVGTRYCSNNCPYKVRRFNWFDYPREDRLQNLVLNPDVTVRTRGVMEKCSLCVQRIEAGKLAAKRRGEPVRDGDIQTACSQSCPSQAIVFGDANDPGSRVARLRADGRHFRVLELLNTQPGVGYLKLVRNRDAAGAEADRA